MKDIRDIIKYVGERVNLSGAQADFLENYAKKMGELGEVLAAEFGVPKKSLTQVKSETPLGPESELAFYELKDWLISQRVIVY